MDRKKEILDTTMRLFFKFGLSRLTLRDIAKECGLRTSAIFYYFENKEMLFKAVLQNFLDGIKEEIKVIFQRQSGFEETLRDYIRVRISKLSQGKEILNNFRQDDIALTYRKFSAKKSIEFISFEVQNITEFIRNNIELGTIRKIEPGSLCSLIIGVTEGLAYRKIVMDEEFDLDQEIEKIMDIITKGVRN